MIEITTRRVIGLLIVVGLGLVLLLGPGPAPPRAPQAQQTAAQQRAELAQDCHNAYGRMCRDETEAAYAGFRVGLNKGLRGD